ncbi:hypothetical protein GCM10027174_09400 [Salinifilum aidingensis]
MRRRRVSLLGRVYTVVVVLVLLLGVMAVGTVVLQRRGEKATTELTTEVVPAQVATSELAAAYVGQESALRGFVNTGDPTHLGVYQNYTGEAAQLQVGIGRQLGDHSEVTGLLGNVDQSARVWREQSVEPAIARTRAQGPDMLSPAETVAERQRFGALRAELTGLQHRVNAIAGAQRADAEAARSTANGLVVAVGLSSLVLAAAALFFLRRSLNRPLRTLVSQVDQVATGDLDRPVHDVQPRELSSVAQAVETMRQRVLEETQRREQVQQNLARHEAAERRRTEQDFATVVTALDEGVIVVNPAGMITAANPSAQRIFGVAESELVGSAIEGWAVFDESGQALPPESHLATQHTGQPQNTRVLQLERRDGQTVWLSVSSRALAQQEQPPHTVVLSFTDITESRAARQRLEHEATHDPLTGLANRALVLRHCDERSPEQPLAVLYLDLDNFKRINDSLGHAAGDEVLRLIGRRLVEVVSADTVVGRLGGDEFVLLAAETAHARLAELSRHLLDAITRPLQLRDRQLHVTANLGIAVCELGDPRTGEDLLRDADLAMYRAKSRNSRYELFDVPLREHVQRHVDLEQDLRQAVDRGQLWVAYQPLVDLDSGRTVGVEGLLRWRHPEHGTVSPAEFIPIAEESDLINIIGAHMLRTATRDLADLRQRHDPSLSLNTNLSPRQLDDPDWQEEIHRALHASGLPATALCLEITEEAIMHDPAQAARALRNLRALGIRLALDDFGTGYSSLSQLRHLPLDILKIDRSFVTDLGTSADLQALVTSIVTMAHALGLTVIAEGVETSSQRALLTQLGCDQAQGYHLGEPAPCHELDV